MTGIYIFHKPSDENQQSTKNDTTLTGYAFLDAFFTRAISMAKLREVELELDICLPDPLPIGETDMEYLLDEMYKVIADVAEQAPEWIPQDKVWAKLITQQEGDELRIECHFTADMEIAGEFMATFVRRACQAGGTADLSLDGEVQTLWASFPLPEHARFPALHRVQE